MKSIYFTNEHRSFRNEVRSFMQQHVLPNAETWELQRQIPKEIFKLMGQVGLLGLHYPSNHGGQAKDIFYSIILLEELGRTGFTGFRVAIALHTYMAIPYILHVGSDFLKQKYLAPAITGQKISCLAITEPQAGSDLNNIKTTAVLQNEHYVINGHKKYVANGQIADFIIAAAKTGTSDKNISLFIIDTNTPGVNINKLDTFNWHSSDTCEITFNNVCVPKENLLGMPNMGFIYIMQGMQLERIAAGVLAIGGIDSCLDHTWEYITKRKVFDQTLSKYQTIRHSLANFVTKTEAIRQFAYHTAWLYANHDLPIAEASMLKLQATELARKVATECIQFHGASGSLEAAPIARIFRDAQAATVAGGASEIMRDIITQLAFDESGWRRYPATSNNVITNQGEFICQT
jgi:alkylation response protein AidB-like acyl-CoA dehydrogenase